MIPVGTPQEIIVPVGFDPDTDELITATQDVYTDFQTKPFGDQLEQNTNSSLFFSLNIPIFNGWFTSTNIQRAEINLKNAAYNQESAELLLEQDVRRAYADAVASQKNFAAAETAYNASTTAHSYAKVRFEEGVINFVDYNSAKVRMDNAQAEMLRNKYDYLFKVKITEFYQGKVLTLR
jgi:outer membrane protein